jgi:hypothetical protein
MRNDEKLAIQITNLRRLWRHLFWSEPGRNLLLSPQDGYYVCLSLFGSIGWFTMRFTVGSPAQSRCRNQHWNHYDLVGSEHYSAQAERLKPIAMG